MWLLDLEQWSWSKPAVSGPSPHPRGGQSQVTHALQSLASSHDASEIDALTVSPSDRDRQRDAADSGRLRRAQRCEYLLFNEREIDLHQCSTSQS